MIVDSSFMIKSAPRRADKLAALLSDELDRDVLTGEAMSPSKKEMSIMESRKPLKSNTVAAAHANTVLLLP